MTSANADPAPGPLAGLRAIEWADDKGVHAGKLLADLGVDVIKVEPPGGDPSRRYGPFLEDRPDPEACLFFWHYNTSKRGITLDPFQPAGRDLLRRLITTADFFIESQPPGVMANLGLDWGDLAPPHPGLIYVSVTPYGRQGPRSEEAATDLTLLANGGPAWSCGYDDHTLPPIRGGGNQGYHIGAHWAVMSALTALVHRDLTGAGQHIDVNIHAACNVTTEAGSYAYLVAGEEVQRQTGRHASAQPSAPTQVRCRDGIYMNSGMPPRRPEEFGVMIDWLRDAGLLDRFEKTSVLELARDGEPMTLAQMMEDPLAMEKFAAGREAVTFVAENMPAYEFFLEGQRRGFQFGIIYAPEDLFHDPHFQDRDFPVAVPHEDLGRTLTYPGAPYRFSQSPWRIRRRAPHLGEDNVAVFGGLLGLLAGEQQALRAQGVI